MIPRSNDRLLGDHWKGGHMPRIKQVGRVMVPVSDQDKAIAFYTDKLGFSLATDVPFGDGERWVEVAPPGGGTALALVPPRGEYQTGRMTGIALGSPDPRADHAELQEKGVDVDAELMGGDGTVPLLFSFRDADGNQLMLVEEQSTNGA
jgi:catechol 2,3-dioxygenase-like lactoylglutathione lyase family enzyme